MVCVQGDGQLEGPMGAAAVVARASDLCSNPHHLKVSGACSFLWVSY